MTTLDDVTRCENRRIALRAAMDLEPRVGSMVEAIIKQDQGSVVYEDRVLAVATRVAAWLNDEQEQRAEEPRQ